MLVHSHADLINKQYLNKGSNFVTLESRLDFALSLASYFKARLEQVVDEFKRRHANPHPSLRKRGRLLMSALTCGWTSPTIKKATPGLQRQPVCSGQWSWTRHAIGPVSK